MGGGGGGGGGRKGRSMEVGEKGDKIVTVVVELMLNVLRCHLTY